MRLRGSHGIPWLVAVATTALVVGPLLVGFEPVGGDPDRMYRPIKAELARALRSGRLPFWSDRFGLGVPLVAESHVAAFYPPNLVLYRLLPVAAAYRLSMWLHYVALTAATYAYARCLGIGPWGGALAGVAFTFCGFQAIHSSHEPFYHLLPYLPLCLLLADRYAATGRLAWLAGLALAFGAQLTLGHYQLQMGTAALVLATGAVRASGERGGWRRGPGLVVGLAWGAAVAAVPLALTWEFARAVHLTHRRAESLSEFAFPPAHWVELVVPFLFRKLRGGPEFAAYWTRQRTSGYEAALYVGTVPLILAAVGLARGGRDRRLAAWGGLAVLAFALASMPRWWPAGYEGLMRLPGPGYFRSPARYTLVTSLGLALLAGAGLEPLARPSRRFGVGLAAAGVIGLGTLVWVGAWGGGPALAAHLEAPGLAVRLGGATLVWGIGLALVAAWGRGRVGPVVPVLAAAIELAALYYAGTTVWGWSVPLPSASPALSRLAREPDVGRVAGPLDNVPLRLEMAPAVPYLGSSLPPPGPLLAVANAGAPTGDPFAGRWLRRLGVTHGVWAVPVAPEVGTVLYRGPDPTLDRLVYRPRGAPERRPWTVVRLPSPGPGAWAATRAIEAPSWATLVEHLTQSDAADEAWFLPGDRPADRSPRARSARVLRWDGREATVEHDGACDLVIRRTAYPGWWARVGGGPERPTVPVDGGLQAVHLDGAGITRVVMTYRPTGLAWSAAASAAALAAALIGVLAPLPRSRRIGLGSPRS